ncbi:hypothetical protein MTO96_034962, partial [Rhipicephalus appendiculatus]
ENHTYYLREGLTPDKPVFTADDGADGERTANYIYTNYVNCAVADIPFKNKQNCGLWVMKDALHSIPQECMNQFEDNCDKTNPVFDDETCKGTFLAFPHAVAVFDADDDGDLDCLFVVRQYVHEDSKTASYMWVLPPVNGRQAENHTYYWREGLTPDKPVFTADDGADGEQTAHFIYTNYENCAVADIPFKNKPNCGLWVTKDALHSIPQECEDQFEDNCDMTVLVFDEETCKGVLDGI